MSLSIQKHIRQAEKLIKLREYKKAEALYLQILTKFPNNINAMHSLKKLKSLNMYKSATEFKQEKLNKLSQKFNKQEFKKVIQDANKLIKAYPKEIDLYNIKGASNAALGEYEKAIKCYEKILQIDTNSAKAYYNIAVMYDSLKAPKESIKYYKYAIKHKADHFDAYNNMGSAYRALGNLEYALKAYNKVIHINPNHAYAHNNIGNLYLLKQLPKEAIKAFKKAIFFNNKYADAMVNLGDAYIAVKRFSDAYQSFSNALLVNPHHAKALVKIAALHARNRDYKKSITAYEKALLYDPTNTTLLAAKISQQAQLCDIDTIKNDIPKIRHAGTTQSPIAPFILVAFDDAPDRQRLRAELYIKDKIFQNFINQTPITISNSRRIRLGYVSSDFRNHPVSQFLAKVIELHDRDIFEIFGYSINPSADDMTKRLKKTFDRYTEFKFEISDAEIASDIRNDAIDILIDLNGYTNNSRPGIFARKPAKIQINYLGYPATMGTDFIDYIIADNVVIPKKYEMFYNEHIIRLPNSYMPTDNTRMISNKTMEREDHGLPSEGIVFCCFNNNYKISSNEFDIWMRLLSKIEGSALWLKINNELARHNVRIAAKKRGVDPKRIIFSDRLSMEEHLARHSLADIFLDTFNFNAHTTACDALWAGLPVVTKIGKSFSARVAGSLLTAVGLTELITNSELEYEELILKLASNPKELKKVKQKLNKNLTSYPLFDTKLYTCNLEKAYKKAYENHVKGKEPNSITISV